MRHLGVATLDLELLLARQIGREIERLLSLVRRLLAETERRPGRRERRMRQRALRIRRDRLLEQLAGRLRLEAAELGETFGVEARRLGIPTLRRPPAAALAARLDAQAFAQLLAALLRQVEESGLGARSSHRLQRLAGQGILQAQIEPQGAARQRGVGAGQDVVGAEQRAELAECRRRQAVHIAEREVDLHARHTLAGHQPQPVTLPELGIEHLGERGRNPRRFGARGAVLESQHCDRAARRANRAQLSLSIRPDAQHRAAHRGEQK